jgi:GNAT superfamily N-acetyltransferase
MVLPDYQRKGFGTILTRLVNSIVDRTGGRTFVPARPTSRKMFEDNGFKVIGYHSCPLGALGRRYGEE